jgi:hypothetical protein
MLLCFFHALPSFSSKLHQLLACLECAVKAQQAEAQAALGTGEAADDECMWIIVKSDVGRCGDGIQVWST